MLDVDTVCVRGDELREAVCPFDDEDGGLFEVFLPADGKEFLRIFHAVEVEVDDWRGGIMVFINECEGGAGDGLGAAEGGADSLGEMSLSRP